MNSDGVLVFDVNDFDEAYLGHFAWDLRRFLASLALMGWQKALPEEDVRRLSRVYLDAYVDQVRHYVRSRRTRRSRSASTTPTARSRRCWSRPACARGSRCWTT